MSRRVVVSIPLAIAYLLFSARVRRCSPHESNSRRGSAWDRRDVHGTAVLWKQLDAGHGRLCQGCSRPRASSGWRHQWATYASPMARVGLPVPRCTCPSPAEPALTFPRARTWSRRCKGRRALLSSSSMQTCSAYLLLVAPPAIGGAANAEGQQQGVARCSEQHAAR